MRAYDFFNKRRVTLQDMNDMQDWIGQDVRNYIGVHMEKGIIRPATSFTLGDASYNFVRQPIDPVFTGYGGGTAYSLATVDPSADAMYFVDSEGNMFYIANNDIYNASPTSLQVAGNIGIPFTSAVGGGGDGAYYVWVTKRDMDDLTYAKQDKVGVTYYPKQFESYQIITVFNNPSQPPVDAIFVGKITKTGSSLVFDYTNKVYAGIKAQNVNIKVDVSASVPYWNGSVASLKDHINAIGSGVVVGGVLPVNQQNPHGTHPNDMAQINLQNITDHCVIEQKLSRTTDPYGASVGTNELQDASVTGQKIASQTITQVNLDPTLVPVGGVIMWAGKYSTIPSGWKSCDGSILPTSLFPNLFPAIGTLWGISPGNVVLPDLRSAFIRGAFNSSAVSPIFNDPDVTSRSVRGSGLQTEPGSTQDHVLNQHEHASPDGFNFVTDKFKSAPGGGSASGSNSGGTQTGGVVGANVSSETRPVNILLFYIIRVL